MSQLGAVLVNMQQDINAIKAAQSMKGEIADKFLLFWEILETGGTIHVTMGKGIKEGDNAWFDITAPFTNQAYFDYAHFAGLIGGDTSKATKS